VQRWEREAGLPVHRVQNDGAGPVYAYKSELDAWFEKRGAELSAEAEPDAIPSVAVLPFTDMSQEGDQGYFCDGIAEEIVNAMSRVQGLRAASRTSSFRFREPGADVREIGRQMGVKALLEGSVRKSGDRLRIAVQLIDSESGFQLWSQRYDRTCHDILEIQERIAESVVQALAATLSRGASSSELTASECYRRGREYYNEFHLQAMEFAIEMFVRAIGLDPCCAAAFAGLADCWSFLYQYGGQSVAVLEQADWASLRALELSPESALVQASRAQWLSVSGCVDEADRAFASALHLDTGLFEAHYFRARHCFALGRVEEAAEAYESAWHARPDDYQTPLLMASIYDQLGRRERAKAARKQGIAIAERHLQVHPEDARALYLSASGSAALGDHDRARKMADRALAIRPEDPLSLYHVACVFALMGSAEAAVEFLEKAGVRGFRHAAWVEQDCDLASLRGMPRFVDLLWGMRHSSQANLAT